MKSGETLRKELSRPVYLALHYFYMLLIFHTKKNDIKPKLNLKAKIALNQVACSFMRYFLLLWKKPQRHPCGLPSPARLIILDLSLYLT